MLKLLAVDDAARATIHAALVYYRQQGMGQRDMRDDDINSVAVGDRLGVEVEPLDDDGILRLEALVLKAPDQPAPKQGLFAQVQDIDGEVAVRLFDSATAARDAILGELDEYDLDGRESELEAAKKQVLEVGWCKVELNLGHIYEAVEITDPESLRLVSRDSALVQSDAQADVPGSEGWLAADERTRELIPGAVYMRTLGGGDSGYATYDLTIVRNDSEMYLFIPMHGSVKMHGAPSAADAALMLMSYWADLPDDSKRVATRPFERPRA